MDKKSLKFIKDMYLKGGNIIQYLRKNSAAKENTEEMILFSYDLQSRSYIVANKKNPSKKQQYTKNLAEIINNLDVQYNSILEVGVGEATTLANLIPKLSSYPKKIYGFDISWSRTKYANSYIKSKNIKNTLLFVADLFDIPLLDNSIDIVYTSHSIEPNSGREKEALLELMRVTKKYLILLEPAYDLASEKAKRRMEKHGYIKNLYETCKSLGLNIIEHRLFNPIEKSLNPTGLTIIKKNFNDDFNHLNPFMCPISKQSLKLTRGSYFSSNGLLVYPVIDQIPCLIKESGVVATHYMDSFEDI